MLDADGQLIYVGKSKSLKDRLLTYFTARSTDTKAGRIAGSARRLLWEPAPHEFAALLRELELIRRWLPKFNVKGKPGRHRRGYVAVGRGPAACAYLAEKPSPRDRLLLGPLWPGSDLQRMIRRVNDCFQLRDCPDRVPIVFSDQQELFAQAREAQCLRHAMGTCLGPCASLCSARQYADRVRAARAFLSGSDLAVLDRLEKAMRRAAAAEQFEKAAALRDAWQDLTALRDLLEQLKTVRQTYSFAYPLPSYRKGESWYLVHRGQVVSVVDPPRSRRASQRCLRTLDEVYHDGPRSLVQTTPDDHDIVLLVSLWFRSHPEELGRTIPPQHARDRCEIAV
jgi:excinuclease ABC subunit C